MSEGLKRREFLKVVGVSGAGAGVLGCSTEKVEHLVPYVVPPEDITPGVATWYTTACSECEAACGMWVRTREGRVVKVEGNPDHPVSRGALCSRGHSSLQGLYNPDLLDLGLLPLIRATDHQVAAHAGAHRWNSGVHRSLGREVAVVTIDLVDPSVDVMGKSDRLRESIRFRGIPFRRRIGILSLDESQRSQEGECDDRRHRPSLRHRPCRPIGRG